MTSKLLTAGSVAPIDSGLDLVDPVDRALDRGPAGRPVPEGAGSGRPVGPLSHHPRSRLGLSHRSWVRRSSPFGCWSATAAWLACEGRPSRPSPRPRQIEPLPAQGFTDSSDPGPQTVYGADFTFAAAPGRVVEGVVRDEKTRTVMKDVGVWSFGFAGSHYSVGRSESS